MPDIKLKAKIRVALVFLILVLPTLANAEIPVYSIEELEALEQDGYIISIRIGIDEHIPTVGENALIDGNVQVNIYEIPHHGELVLPFIGYVHGFKMNAYIYHERWLVYSTTLVSNDEGRYKIIDFIPRDSGCYTLILTNFVKQEWPLDDNITMNFYVSEKDSDADGVPDPYDYAPYDRDIQTIRDAADIDDDGIPDQYDYDPYDPDVQSRSDLKMPGFEACCAVAGLLAVAVLLRRRRYIK